MDALPLIKRLPLAALVAGFSVAATLPAAASASESTWTFTGTAHHIDNDDVLYREHHAVIGECLDDQWQPRTHEVEYRRDGKEEPFATKTLDYAESAWRPGFDFRQPDFDERMVAENRDDSEMTIDWKTIEGEEEDYSVELEDSVVVDAGFDNYVRDNWQKIDDGESLDFRFLAPTRGEHYAFELNAREDHEAVDAAVIVTINPSGFITKRLVDPITLGYSEEGYLTDYYGLTNVREGGDNYTAHIRYEQEDSPECRVTSR